MGKLNYNLALKKKKSYDTFAVSDKDRDGVIKREEFAHTLSNVMNICNKHSTQFTVHTKGT